MIDESTRLVEEAILFAENVSANHIHPWWRMLCEAGDEARLADALQAVDVNEANARIAGKRRQLIQEPGPGNWLRLCIHDELKTTRIFFLQSDGLRVVE
jgi:hypothetical protein